MKIIIAVTILLISFYLVGPTPSFNTKLNKLTLPDTDTGNLGISLDSYIDEREASFVDITPGTEKKIIWANPDNPARTEWSFVYFHGFGATRQELMPVPEDVARHFNGNIYFARLSGHGRTPEALRSGNISAWAQDTHEALILAEKLGDKVVVIATSTGATLAAWYLQQDYAPKVEALVLVSPNFKLKNPLAAILIAPWGEHIGRTLIGEYREWQPQNDLQRSFWTYRQPIESVIEMVNLVDHVGNLPFEQLEVPVQLLYNPGDQIIDADTALAKVSEMKSAMKDIEIITEVGDKSNHVLAGDAVSPHTNKQMTDHIIRFLGQL